MAYNEEDKGIHELAAAFARFIPVLAGTAGMKSTRFLTAEVTELSDEDEKNRVCTAVGVLDNEEIIYKDVNLSMERNDGFIQVPAIGSTVLIGKMPDGETYILHCSDIDKIICVIDGSNKYVFDSTGFIWNDGALGGLTKVISLTAKLNNLENKLNSLLLVLGTTWIPVANDGGAALKALCVPPLTTALTATVRADIENTKIKH